VIISGDLVEQNVDAIVNAANNQTSGALRVSMQHTFGRARERREHHCHSRAVVHRHRAIFD